MSPPATATLASPAVRPAVSVLIASARTGPAASVKPAAEAADADMKPRRDSGVALVRPTISCILVCIFMCNLPIGSGDLRDWGLEGPGDLGDWWGKNRPKGSTL